MAEAPKKRVQTFYRMIKAGSGHQFAGLYAVEKLRFKDGMIVHSEIVHEWDTRLISEAILARLGGQDAFDNFVEDTGIDLPEVQCVTTAVPRTPEEIAEFTKRKLKAEFVAPSKAAR